MIQAEPTGTEERSDDASSGETKRERFLRVAERRTNNVLYRIRVLSNCANTYSYEFSPADVEMIFDAIDGELLRARSRFEISKPSKFTFDADGGALDDDENVKVQEEG